MRKFIPFRNSTKDGREPGAADDAYHKRREQVRRAQRTHRERKEAYTKNLESEVLRLRVSETTLLQENQTLHAEIERLQQKLASHGIHDDHPSRATTQEAQSLQHSSPVVSIGRNTSHDLRLTVHQPPSPSTSTTTSPSPSPSPTPTPTPCLATTTQLGLDFVLTLESPCLPHLHDHGGGGPADPTGHVLTASAALLEQCPLETDPLKQQQQQQQQQSQQQPTTWQTASAGLERLLDLSGRIETDDGELTPVQAWNLIKRHPRFGEVREPERWARLTSEVAREVRCVG